MDAVQRTRRLVGHLDLTCTYMYVFDKYPAAAKLSGYLNIAVGH